MYLFEDNPIRSNIQSIVFVYNVPFYVRCKHYFVDIYQLIKKIFFIN